MGKPTDKAYMSYNNQGPTMVMVKIEVQQKLMPRSAEKWAIEVSQEITAEQLLIICAKDIKSKCLSKKVLHGSERSRRGEESKSERLLPC